MTRWLIAGAGFTGSVLAERIATVLGQRVILTDIRSHVGGNAYDERDISGIDVHRYGPHIFHTNSERIWRYLSRFTDWIPYRHRILADIGNGLIVPVPPNLETIESLFPYDGELMSDRLIAELGYNGSRPVRKLMDHTDPLLRRMAEKVWESLFVGYTTKQWGVPPDRLDPLVTARVPVRATRSPDCFPDMFQGIPSDGYSSLFSRVLINENIEIVTGADARSVPTSDYERLIWTGPIDDYFNYSLGFLPYRSLRFSQVVSSFNLPVGTVNYPNTERYTRITDMGILCSRRELPTVHCYEYPSETGEPYYPVLTDESSFLYRQYLKLGLRESPNVLFAGRLADFRYYNMDQAVARALSVFDKITSE